MRLVETMLLAAKIAIAFLTILPARLPAELPVDGLRRSAGFFPLVGWLIGGVLAGSAWIFVWAGLPPLVSAVLLVTCGAWLTRGLHLDGLADLLDGLGGGQTPERRLAIMKDSATGAFGVIGLALLLVLKVACLAALLAHDKPLVWMLPLFAAPVTARWAMTGLACGTHYPREAGTGHAFVGKVRGQELLVGWLFLLPLPWEEPLIVVVMAAAMLPACLLRFKATKALGGITGDVLGASCELGEACGWLAAVVLCSLGV
ncbi:MAG: adenosylcobinamide-GDP ribazoletransferase [Deltaproteobacteria bacterium]|nr:adenosylcobinamide-GDP ribazoletransferase [Deltaproteobacteria bacterium]